MKEIENGYYVIFPEMYHSEDEVIIALSTNLTEAMEKAEEAAKNSPSTNYYIAKIEDSVVAQKIDSYNLIWKSRP